LPKDEERLVANGEKWASERRENLQFIIRPFYCGKRIAKRDDLLAIMKRAPADENVRNSPALKRADVGSRNIGTETAEPAEKDGNVARSDRNGITVLFDRPVALIYHPIDKSSDRVWE
jgi:hypothetical protein